MKRFIGCVKAWLEMWGRARAAAYLARQGDYRAAQDMYRD